MTALSRTGGEGVQRTGEGDKETSTNASRFTNDASRAPKLVILVQDLHANAKVQKTISEILEFYEDRKSTRLNSSH